MLACFLGVERDLSMAYGRHGFKAVKSWWQLFLVFIMILATCFAIAPTSSGVVKQLSHAQNASNIYSWQTQSASPQFGDGTCFSTTLCFAVGSTGNGYEMIWKSTNDGWTWQSYSASGSSPSSTVGTLNFVACASASFCMAAGYKGSNGGVTGNNDIWYTSDSGNSLTEDSIAGVGSVTNLRCFSPNICFVDSAAT